MKITFITSDAYVDTVVPLINALLPYADVTMIVNCLYSRADTVLSGSIAIARKHAITEISHSQRAQLKGYMGLLDTQAKNLRVGLLFYENFSTISLYNWPHTYAAIRYIGSTDIIHMQHQSALYFFLLRRPAYDKLVADIHDVIQHSGAAPSVWSQLLVYRWLYRSRAIITHNTFEYNLMKKNRLFSRKKIYMFPLGPVRLTPQPLTHEQSYAQPMVLFFGRICPYKGIEYLAQAVTIVKRAIPHLKVIIAGSGKYYFDTRVFKDNATYEIINHYIPNEQLQQLIHKSTIVVCPYTDATQSGVVMTAFAYGKPVVATNVGGIAEIVEDGVTGSLVPPQDPARLAEAIQELLTNETMRENMALKIRKKFGTENQTWDTIAAQTMDVYKSIIAKT